MEFFQENTMVIANTLFQHRREDSTHGYQHIINIKIRLIIFFAAKDGEALCSQQKQDKEQRTVAQIMNSLLPILKLKQVGKTTRPYRYDLNQIPHDYTVDLRNRFKELDLTDRVHDELQTEICDIVQETGIRTTPKKKKCKKRKMAL